MNFSIPQKELSIALTRCAAIAATSRTSMPILSSVMLTPLANILKICATDLEIGSTTVIDGIIWNENWNGTEPAFLLPAKTLNYCVKAIPSGEVTFDITDNIVKITGGTVAFTLSGLDAEDFPVVSIAAGQGIAFDPTALGHTLKHVAYCQCKDETKPNLHGVFLQMEHNDEGDLFFHAAATDGHRLCTDTNPATKEDNEALECSGEIPAGLIKGITIPMKGVSELIKLVGDSPAVMSLTGNTLIVSTGDEILSLRLTEMAFPDVRRIIPVDQPHTVQVKRQSLIDALERCRIITNKDSRRVNLTTVDGMVSIFSEMPVIGAQATDRISAEYVGDIPAISMNVEYLLQALTNMSGASVELHLTDQLTPMVINPSNTESPSAIVMPMRVA